MSVSTSMQRRRAIRRLAGASVGNFGEVYDFTVYALTAPILAQHFFPSSNPTAGILGTFAVYALAFLARPVGGFVFGVMADKRGRIVVLAWTVVLMGLGTMAIGLLPSYDSIGITATILLVLCRLAQGLSMGGESSGSYTYVIESAPEGQRGRWVGIVASFSYSPAVVTGLIILGFSSALGDSYEEWGWRLPFILGGVVALVGYLLRRKLDDPDEYTEAMEQQAQQQQQVSNPVLGVAKSRAKSMVLVVLLLAIQAVSAYLVLGYMFTFTTEQGLGHTEALLTNAATLTIIVVLLPIVGTVTDKFGRKPVLLVGAAWFMLTVIPAFALASSGTVLGALVGQSLICVGVGIYAGSVFAVMLELFPTSLRATGHAISFNVGAAIFGGTTPLIAAALVESTGSPMAPAYYAIAVSFLGLIGIFMTPETRHVTLRHGVQKSSGEAVEEPALSSPRD